MAKTIPGVRWDAKREKWFIDYYDGHGRRHREWGIRSRPFKSQREAADALASRRQSILADRYEWKPREASPPFSELLGWYLQRYSPEKRSHALDLSNAKPLRTHFGAKRVDEITPDDVQGFKMKQRQTISRKTKRPLSEATVDLRLNLLKAIFSQAVKDNKAKANPVKGVTLFKPDNRRRQVLTAADMERLFAELPAYVLRPVQTLLSTGLRVSEVMNLKRQDVIFKDGGTVLQVTRKGGRKQVVPVGSHLTNLLIGVVKSLPGGPQAPLWLKPNGQPLKSFRTAWENACMRAGLDNLWVHDLRRTFGTKAIENGTNIVTVRQILGHSNVNTTERYLWPEAKQQREAVEAVSAWVDTALNGQQALAADNAEPAQLAEK